MFKERSLDKTIKSLSKVFPVILLTGPRQVGKTTLLEQCASPERKYVSLDDIDNRELAQRDPALFLQIHEAPLIIDEVQYAPQLFNQIKIIVDKNKNQHGMFWLTGSQRFHLMHNIGESLAGRVAIIDMLGLSQAEIDNESHNVIPFLPTENWLNHAKKKKQKKQSLKDIYDRIWRGSFPRLVTEEKIPWEIFFNSYIQTYIQRDVRAISNIVNETQFNRFLQAIAARTAQLINYADLARDVDVDQKTIKSWLAVLETSGLIYLLQPYYNNLSKRLIKSPKLYFLDTGLCAYLCKWSSAESLEAGAMSGAILETYIFSEILKSYWHTGKQEYFYFYRDKDQKEIDLLIEEDQTLYPIEFKKTATPSKDALKNLSALEQLNVKIGEAAIICLRETEVKLSTRITAIPLNYLK